MRVFWSVAVMVAVGVAAGCHHAEQERDPRAMTPVAGHGKLLSINQVLGGGTLEINGKVVTFWWNNQGRTPGSEGNPEVMATELPFPAKLGDEIYFRGVQNRGEIFITAAAAVKK